MTLAARVEGLLYAALLEEVHATPKPGLVDIHDSGAHRDMDLRTFTISAAAITPFLRQMFDTGQGWKQPAAALFQFLRPVGREAEAAMLSVTHGVNTHKGAIFTLGILASAAGLEYQRTGGFSSTEILDISREMTASTLQEELTRLSRQSPHTHGEQLYVAAGAAGIRGEAMLGFPSLRTIALPALTEGGQPDRNGQLLYVLLRLMAAVEDTTILHRAGKSGLAWAQAQARAFLSAWPVMDASALRELSIMNDAFVRRNISPGGSADLLAAAVFLAGLEALSPSGRAS